MAGTMARHFSWQDGDGQLAPPSCLVILQK